MVTGVKYLLFLLVAITFCNGEKPSLTPRHFYARDLPTAFAYTGHVFQPSSIYTAALPYVVGNFRYQLVQPLTAAVDLNHDDIQGRITFVQPHPPSGPVFMSGNITGLSPGKHGIHIHMYGDLSKGCESMGSHYNPHLANHGGPADPYRHIGDLGNIIANEHGHARLEESDHVISLVGQESIIGRGLVIHEQPDDLGRGGDMESLRTGNAGSRIACGIVGWVMPADAAPPVYAAPLQNEPEEPKDEA